MQSYTARGRWKQQGRHQPRRLLHFPSFGAASPASASVPSAPVAIGAYLAVHLNGVAVLRTGTASEPRQQKHCCKKLGGHGCGGLRSSRRMMHHMGCRRCSCWHWSGVRASRGGETTVRKSLFSHTTLNSSNTGVPSRPIVHFSVTQRMAPAAGQAPASPSWPACTPLVTRPSQQLPNRWNPQKLNLHQYAISMRLLQKGALPPPRTAYVDFGGRIC